jgi:hypothetical protein
VRRSGTEADWRELHRVIDAMVRGHISFSRFAELGKRWLQGADSEELSAMLPMSETERVMRYLRGVGPSRYGASARSIDKSLGFRAGRTAELCARLRQRGLVRTEREGNGIRVYGVDAKRARGKSGRRGK